MIPSDFKYDVPLSCDLHWYVCLH